MRKSIFTFTLILFWGMSGLLAQEVHETSRKFMKKSAGNALSIVIQGQPKNVEHVLNDLFKSQTGNKGKTSKGVTAFEGSVFRRISSGTMDYYFEVEKPSKGDEIHSRVSLFIAEGNQNFISSSTHPEQMKAAKTFMKGLEMDVKKYEFQVAIDDQTKLIEKEEKNYEKMYQDSLKLETKLAETLQALEEIKVNRASQKVKIAEEKDRLVEFRTELGRLKGKND